MQQATIAKSNRQALINIESKYSHEEGKEPIDNLTLGYIWF